MTDVADDLALFDPQRWGLPAAAVMGLARRARGSDDWLIVTERAAKSISQETTFACDVTDRATLERTLREQAAKIAQKLRRDDLLGTTVKLKIRWPDFTTPTRQLTLLQLSSYSGPK